MSLRRKLERLKKQTDAHLPGSAAEGANKPTRSVPVQPTNRNTPSLAEPFAEGKTDRIARLRTMIDKLSEHTQSRPERHSTDETEPKWERLMGREVVTEHGCFHLIEQLLEPDHHHGSVPVCCALNVDPKTVAKLALDPRLTEIALDRMVIVDTETTGLSGGTGTVPFLVGLAWFEDGALRVEQLLLKSLSQETPVLFRIAERLAWANVVVSYNGKSFDLPLLRTRFILNRVAMPAIEAHLDLLHVARRVLKPRLDEVRLTQVERELLGFYREGDVDGSEIPELYLRFLRGADPAILAPIIEHNANDVIALAAILGKLTQHFESVQPADDPRDHLAYAKVASRARDHERALSFARAAAEYGGSDDVTYDALVLTAQLARRSRDPHASAKALHQALQNASSSEAISRIHLALAKLYEHALKDLPSAHQHALHTAEAEGESGSLKRIRRIERRIQGAKRNL